MKESFNKREAKLKRAVPVGGLEERRMKIY